MMAPLLRIQNLAVELGTTAPSVRVVDGVSFELNRGETLGLVGESGSGKTVTALALLGMIAPPNGRVSGSVRLDGRELSGLDRRDWHRIRGNEIAMVFQEPRRSLDPAFTVGDQVAETIRRQLGSSRGDARRRAIELFDLVGIPAPKQRIDNYPHQFSGGMAQRVMLAIALSCSPKVLIADEPTTALDVTVQAKVLDLIRDVQREFGLAVLFISHDLGVIAEMCGRVAVMYAGQIVEHAVAEELFLNPRHPYTAALLQSIPHRQAARVRMSTIPGVVPSPHAWPSGCRFHPRCSYVIEPCRTGVPPMSEGARARCLRASELTLAGVE